MIIINTECDNLTRTIRGTFQGTFYLDDVERYIYSMYTHVTSITLVFFVNESDVQDGMFKFNFTI